MQKEAGMLLASLTHPSVLHFPQCERSSLLMTWLLLAGRFFFIGWVEKKVGSLLGCFSCLVKDKYMQRCVCLCVSVLVCMCGYVL